MGGTFAGNPVACAAGLAVVDAIETREAVRARRAPGRATSGDALGIGSGAGPSIGDVRGLGGMRAIELVQPGTRRPAAEETSRITRYCYEHGVVALSTGSFSNVIRRC